MIIKINKHAGKESWYGKMRTVSSAEAKLLKGRESPNERLSSSLSCGSKSPFLLQGRCKSEQEGLKLGKAVADLWYFVLSSCQGRVQAKGNRTLQAVSQELEEWAPLQPPGCMNWLMYKPEHQCNAFIYKEDAPCQRDQMFMLTGQRILSCWKIYMESQIIIKRLFVSMKSEQREGIGWALWHP